MTPWTFTVLKGDYRPSHCHLFSSCELWAVFVNYVPRALLWLCSVGGIKQLLENNDVKTM